jgi:hypothetical protein
LAGCRSKQSAAGETAYVSAPQVVLRDRVAAVFNKVGTVSNGEKVEVLERSNNKRFARVRSADGKEGWMEARYLVAQDVYTAFAKLAAENLSAPTQATAVARRAVNLHVQPARDADALYQLKEGAKLQLLKRASTPKSGMKALAKQEEAGDDEEDKPPATPPPSAKSSAKGAATKPGVSAANILPPDPIEDWWLARDEEKRVGWVLGRMMDVEVPLEIAQYAEGQRIVGSFVLNEVPRGRAERPRPTPGRKGKPQPQDIPQETGAPQDPNQLVPQYAVLMTEPKDGLPFDFNQLRVFTWNPHRSRYETAYRERLEGQLPFVVSKEDFGKEGVLPTFIVRDRTKAGGTEERKFKLNGVMVRRVQAAGEAKAPSETLRPKTASAKKEKSHKKRR